MATTYKIIEPTGRLKYLACEDRRAAVDQV